jgi:hypothetical protein
MHDWKRIYPAIKGVWGCTDEVYYLRMGFVERH